MNDSVCAMNLFGMCNELFGICTTTEGAAKLSATLCWYKANATHFPPPGD